MSGAWEFVDGETTRLRVPGGYLYRHQRVCIGVAQPPATIVFVPYEPDRPIPTSEANELSANEYGDRRLRRLRQPN